MPQPLRSKTLEKDQEIREARFGFMLVIWFLGIWSLLRFADLLGLFSNEVFISTKLITLIVMVSLIGVTAISIRRVLSLSKLRATLLDDPEKYCNVKFKGRPNLNTFIPFLLK